MSLNRPSYRFKMVFFVLEKHRTNTKWREQCVTRKRIFNTHLMYKFIFRSSAYLNELWAKSVMEASVLYMARATPGALNSNTCSSIALWFDPGVGVQVSCLKKWKRVNQVQMEVVWIAKESFLVYLERAWSWDDKILGFVLECTTKSR